MRTLRALQIVEKSLHGLQASGVDRLQDVERREQERAGAAGGIQNRDPGKRLPEGADEFRTLAAGDDVLSELLDVQIAGDEVVDRRDLAGGEFGVDLLVVPAPGHVLAPRLRRQGIVARGRRSFQPPRLDTSSSPAAISGGSSRLSTRASLCVDVVGDPVSDRLVEIAVRIVLITAATHRRRA